MIDLIGEMVFGLAMMFAVFGSVGIALGLGAAAAAAVCGAIEAAIDRRERMRRRC